MALYADFMVRSLEPEYVSGDFATPGQVTRVRLRWREKAGGGYHNQYDSLTVAVSSGSIAAVSETEEGIDWDLTPSGSTVFAVRIQRAQMDATPALKNFDQTYGCWIQVNSKIEVMIPADIDPTAGTNVHAQLQAFFNSLPNGRRAVAPEGAIYKSNYKLALANRWGLDIQGLHLNGTYNKRKEQDPARKGFNHLEIQGGGDIILQDYRVWGPRPSGETRYIEATETWHGISFEGVNKLRIIDPIIENVQGDFLNPGALDLKNFRELHNDWPNWDVEVSGSYALVDGDGYLTGAEGIIGGYMNNCGRMFAGITGAAGFYWHHCSLGNGPRSGFDVEPGANHYWNEDIRILHHVLRDRLQNNIIANAGAGEWIKRVEIGWIHARDSSLRSDINGGIERETLYLHHFKSNDELRSGRDPFEISGWKDITVDNILGVVQGSRGSPAVSIRNPLGTYDIDRDTINVTGARVDYRVEYVTENRVIRLPKGTSHYIIPISGKVGNFLPGEMLTFTLKAITGAVAVRDEGTFLRFNAQDGQKMFPGGVVTGAISGATAVVASFIHRGVYNVWKIIEDDVVIYESDFDPEIGEPPAPGGEEPSPPPPTTPLPAGIDGRITVNVKG